MKTRSGGVVKPSAVSALVSNAIANVVKRLKAERLKAKKETDAARAAERLRHLQRRDVVQLAALRRKDAEAVEKLLEVGACPVRLKLRPLFPYVRNDFASPEEKREAMRSTSWAFCAQCDAATEGRDGWHAARCAHRCHAPPSPLLPPEPADALDEPPPPPPPTFPKCQRKLCTKPPTPDHVLTSTNVVCEVSEHDYNLESPLKRALRQKAHSHKHALGMNDVVFYKHMRDHNLEPEEAHAEVLRRKRLIHAGCSSTYEPPEMGHLVLGLLNGVPVDDPTPPPPSRLNPWQTYVQQRELDKSGIVEALRAF